MLSLVYNGSKKKIKREMRKYPVGLRVHMVHNKVQEALDSIF